MISSLTIKDTSLKKANITIPQSLILLAYGFNISPEDFNHLIELNLLTSSTGVGSNKKFIPTSEGQFLIKKIILDGKNTEDIEISEARLKNLYTILSNLFPKGKKPGTNNYWRGNSLNVMNKLKLFFKKYGEFTDDMIIQTTKRYVESFNGNFGIMRTLPYFIEKNGESDLMTFLENYADEEENQEWTMKLK